MLIELASLSLTASRCRKLVPIVRSKRWTAILSRRSNQSASVITGQQESRASLAYLAHREEIEVIFTLDHRDFSVYRTGRKRPFEIVPAR